MKICLHCGQENEDKENFCKFCGRPIQKEEVAPAPIPEPNLPNPNGEVLI